MMPIEVLAYTHTLTLLKYKIRPNFSNEYYNVIWTEAERQLFMILLLFLAALSLLTQKCPQLIKNETNNRAEHYMALLLKYNMGKRINLVSRGSCQARANLASLSFDQGTPNIINSQQ